MPASTRPRTRCSRTSPSPCCGGSSRARRSTWPSRSSRSGATTRARDRERRRPRGARRFLPPRCRRQLRRVHRERRHPVGGCPGHVPGQRDRATRLGGRDRRALGLPGADPTGDRRLHRGIRGECELRDARVRPQQLRAQPVAARQVLQQRGARRELRDRERPVPRGADAHARSRAAAARLGGDPAGRARHGTGGQHGRLRVAALLRAGSVGEQFDAAGLYQGGFLTTRMLAYLAGASR